MAAFIIGSLITFLGLAFLGENLGWWSTIAWEKIAMLWPLILILIGLRLLVKSVTLFLIGAIIIAGLATVMVALGAPATQKSMHFEKSWSWGNEAQATFNQGLEISNLETVALDLDGHYDIQILTHDKQSVLANLTGAESVIKQLKWDGSETRVELNDSPTPAKRIYKPRVTGTITIPATSTLFLYTSGLSDIDVTNHTGSVTVDSSGASKITFTGSATKDPTISLSGAGQVKLDSCTGKATFDMSGAGEIMAKTCTLDSLNIEASGAGKITINSGSIKDADIDTSGASSITIPKPSGTVKQDTSGPSKINFE